MGGTTPPSPTLRRTDQAGRTIILVRCNTLMTSYRSREETTFHTYLGSDPSHQIIQEMQAGYNLRPCSNARSLALFMTGSLDRRPVQPRNPVRPTTIHLKLGYHHLGDLAVLKLSFSLD
ncbi:hypothetical protein PIB30_061554 [Stylosanthes scabra]|uniref:Uncharacterized protein n=1 Tax=Stylosanthes scabra TaxID=79078 RepID=A0ABU6TNB1_9FABA|nr:hypothetical protein [Stylosanthes scabra]